MVNHIDEVVLVTTTLNGLLRKKRREHGWTNKEVGEMVGAHHSLISAYETGRRRPTLKFLQKLAKLYDVPYLDLLAMREEQKESSEYKGQKRLYAAERKNKKYEEALHDIRKLAKEGNTLEIRKIATEVLYF